MKKLKTNYLKPAVVILVLTLMTGCAGWRTKKSVDITPVPEKFHQADSLGKYIDESWWTVFGDSILNDLMITAFKDNLNIEQSAARLDQFRASMQVSQATWFPSVNASATYTESESLEERSLGASFNIAQFQQKYSLGLSAAYELDIWGKLKAGRSASFADYLAGEEDLRALVLMTSAYVAKTYYSVVDLKMQMDLMNKTVESYEANYRMISDRYMRGLVSSQDVYQASSMLESVKAQKSQIEMAMASSEYALCILLGKYPETGEIVVNDEIPAEVAVNLPGLPSELLQRRPDVRSAMRRLEAADYRSAEAVAQLYPSFSLSANLFGSGNELSEAVDPENVFWTAMGNIALPLIDGGRRRANADRAEAAWRAEVANYKTVVLNAFKEVENALISEKKQRDYIDHMQALLSAAENTMRLSEERYFRGVTDYLPVVLAQTSYYNARRNLITGMRNLIESRVNLMTAVGGGWTDEIIEKYVSDK